MVRHSRFIVASAAVVASLVGCTLLVDTSDLTGDVSSPDPSEAGGDTATDGAGVDAGGDVEIPADAQGCAREPNAAFCQDFDDPNTALSASTWTSTDIGSSNGSIALSDSGASAPNSVRFELKPDGGCGAGIQLHRTVTRASYAKVTFKSQAYGESDGYFGVASVDVPHGQYNVLASFETPLQITFRIQPYLDGGISEIAALRIPLDIAYTKRWIPIIVEITSSGLITVTADGRSDSFDTKLPTKPTNASIDVGPFCESAGTAVRLDDVSITFD